MSKRSHLIYDWRKERFVSVSRKRFKRYQKLMAKLHNVMYAKKEKVSKDHDKAVPD